MLTHHDVTIPNALEVFEEIKDTGLKFIGCKDIGLPIDEEKHFMGVEKAIRIGADYLIGGMPRFTRKTLEYLKEKKANLKFFPYTGKVIGHPCVLEGSVDEIVNNGVEFGKMGIHGINLLLYRYTGDVNLLLEKVIETLKIPLIVAGSIDNFEKINLMKRKGVWAFTIGGAILEKKFVPKKNIKEQVTAVLNLLQ